MADYWYKSDSGFYSIQTGSSHETGSGIARILKFPVHRNCTLAKAARSGTDELARSMGKKFSLDFSVTRMGSRGTFMVSWRAWCSAELALFMLTLLHAPSTKFSH